MTIHRAQYRARLPQTGNDLFLSDSGLETTLIFHHGIDLPLFAAFVLLRDPAGRARLRRYFEAHIDIARRHGLGIVLESPTWRASADWGARLGYDPAALAAVNRVAIEELAQIRKEHETAASPIVISGNLGPRGDGYRPDYRMSAAEAEDYHDPQVATFAGTAADMAGAFTMNYVEEAIGITRAARRHALPVAVAFTLETDGHLPSGQPLADAIAEVDAATAGHPAYFLINCAHPVHFRTVLDRLDAPTAGRIRGLRANASQRSHAELDAATDLDDGDPEALAAEYGAIRRRLPRLAVVGGCCGTDHRHVARIAAAFSGGPTPPPAAPCRDSGCPSDPLPA